MAEKEIVEVTAIWTRRIGNNVETLVEMGGSWRLVHTNQLDTQFGHISESRGWKNWPLDRLDVPEPNNNAP